LKLNLKKSEYNTYTHTVTHCLHLFLDAQSYPRHVLGTTITSLTLNLTPNLTYLEISERNVEKCCCNDGPGSTKMLNQEHDLWANRSKYCGYSKRAHIVNQRK